MTLRPAFKRWDEVARRLPLHSDTVAAEVGVWRGQMSERLLAILPRLTLHMVDLWLPGTENGSWLRSGSKMAAEPRATVEAALARCEALARQYAPRAHMVREASASAAARFADASMDLVFIDADHSQLAVAADIQAWRPKVKPGGWLGGHDYGSPRFPGVKDAVLMTFRREQVEAGANATWWVRL